MAEVVATKVIEIDVRQSREALDHIRQIAKNSDSATTNLQRMADRFKTFGIAVKGALAFDILQKLQQLAGFAFDSVEAFGRLETRLSALTGTQRDAANAMGDILNIANATGKPLANIGDLYDKLIRVGGDYGLTAKEVATATQGFADSLRLSGSTGNEAASAIQQFGQALSSGKFQGDEFKSMTENNTVFVRELAKSLGTTVGGLRDMATEGKLTANTLRDAFKKIGDDGKTLFERLTWQAQGYKLSLSEQWQGVLNELGALFNQLWKAMMPPDIGGKPFLIWVRDSLKSYREEIVRLTDYLKSDGISTWEKFQLILSKFPGFGQTSGQTPTPDLLGTLEEKARTATDAVTALEEKIGAYQKRMADDPMFGSGFALQAYQNQLDARKAELETITKAIDTQRTKLHDQLKAAEKAIQPLPSAGGFGPVSDPKATAELERVAKHIEGLLRKARSSGDELLDLQKDLADAYAKTGKSAKDAAIYQKGMVDIEKIRAARDVLGDFIKTLNEPISPENKVEIQLNEMAEAARQANRQVEYLWAKLATATPEQVPHIIELIGQLQGELKKSGDAVKDWGDVFVDQLSSVFENASDAFTDMLLKKEKNFSTFVTAMLEDMLRLQIRWQITQALMAAFPSAFPVQGGTLMPTSEGAAFANGRRLTLYSKGGVFDTPTVFPMAKGAGLMAEAGPEAVMPLSRGPDGRLGVESRGGDTYIEIVNNTPDKVKAETTRDPYGNERIAIMIDSQVNESLGAGKYDKVLSTAYGISRKGR